MLIFDIETDGLLPNVSKIHCIVTYNPNTQKYMRYGKFNAPIEEGIQALGEADEIAGHNIIAFDIPVIKKLYPWFTHNKVTDTMVLARLVMPDVADKDYAKFRVGLIPANLIGSHSLKAWGYRLGVLKGAFAETTDWQECTPEMIEHCRQDVTVTMTLLLNLQSFFISKSARDLEHRVQEIIARQERYGVLFDTTAAEKLYLELREKREVLQRKLKTMFEPWYEPETKDGKPVEFVPKKNDKAKGYYIGCPMTKIKYTKFNPASNKHIARNFIKKYGWTPTDFTPKSNEPVVNEDILKALPYPEAPQLAEYWLLNKRCAQIAEGAQAWLKTVEQDGRIHGAVNTMGAVTRRMAHFRPNLAQVPAAYSPYGKECRSLFTVPTGYKLVGCDAEGLEARCLAHYLSPWDGGEYAHAVVEGKKEDGTDIHTINWKALGSLCKDRDTAKTYFYAWMYGAGDAKLASILGCTTAQAKKAKKQFLNNLPAMKNLKAAIDQKVKEKGYLMSIDGQPLKIRSAHSALNTLLQSAGAIIMKRALVILDETLQENGLVPGFNYEFVLQVHDEFELEVMDKDGLPEFVGKTAAESITRAGEYYNFKCPLAGDYKIGNTWFDVH